MKPEKRPETILKLSMFVQRLIQYYSAQVLDEATKAVLGTEGANVLQAVIRWFSEMGEHVWDALYASVVEFFRPK